jgi:hypothetical protein
MAAQSGPMSNDDVVLMVTNKLSEKIIIGAIDNAANTGFDVTANGLVKLKKPDSKIAVSNAVILEVQKIAAAKQPRLSLTNADVIAMVAGGLGDEIILRAMENAASTSFDTSPKGLVDLKVAKVNDKVVQQMQKASAK